MAIVRDEKFDDWIKKFQSAVDDLKLKLRGPDSPGTGEVMGQVDQGRLVTVNIGDVGRFRISMTSDGRMRCQCGGMLDIAWFLALATDGAAASCEHVRSVLATGRVFFEQTESGESYPVFVFSRGGGRVVAKPADGAQNPAVAALAAVISQLALYGTNSKTATENAKKIISKLKSKGYMIVLSEGTDADLVSEQVQRLADAERKKRIAEKAAAELAARQERERMSANADKKTRWIQLDD
jgi:hypothetical protein